MILSIFNEVSAFKCVLELIKLKDHYLWIATDVAPLCCYYFKLNSNNCGDFVLAKVLAKSDY